MITHCDNLIDERELVGPFLIRGTGPAQYSRQFRSVLGWGALGFRLVL